MTLQRGIFKILAVLGFIVSAICTSPLYSQTSGNWNTVQNHSDSLLPEEMDQIYDSLRRLANRELERMKLEAQVEFETISEVRELRSKIEDENKFQKSLSEDSLKRFEENESRSLNVLTRDESKEIRQSNKRIQKYQAQIERMRKAHAIPARERFLQAVREHRIYVSVVKKMGRLIYTSGRPTLDESGQYPASYFLEGIEGGTFLSNAIQDRFELVLIESTTPQEELVIFKQAPREDFRTDFSQPIPKKLHSKERKRILRADIPLEINRRKDGSMRSLSASWEDYWPRLKKLTDRINVYTDADVMLAKDSIVNPQNPNERITEVIEIPRGRSLSEKALKIGNAVAESASWRKAFQSLISAGGQAVIAASVFHLFHPEATDFHLTLTAVTTFSYAWMLGTFSKTYDRICRLPGNYFGEVGIRMITHIPLLVVKSAILGGWVAFISPRVYLSSATISLVDKVGSTISSIIPRQREKYGLNEGRYFKLFDKTFSQRELISAWPRMLLQDAALLFTNSAGEASSLGKMIQILSVIPYFMADLLHLRSMERKFPHRAGDLGEDRARLMSLIDLPAAIMKVEEVVDRMRGLSPKNPLAQHNEMRCNAIMSRLEAARAYTPTTTAATEAKSQP